MFPLGAHSSIEHLGISPLLKSLRMGISLAGFLLLQKRNVAQLCRDKPLSNVGLDGFVSLFAVDAIPVKMVSSLCTRPSSRSSRISKTAFSAANRRTNGSTFPNGCTGRVDAQEAEPKRPTSAYYEILRSRDSRESD